MSEQERILKFQIFRYNPQKKGLSREEKNHLEQSQVMKCNQ